MDRRAVARADDDSGIAAVRILVDDPLAEPLDVDVAQFVRRDALVRTAGGVDPGSSPPRQ